MAQECKGQKKVMLPANRLRPCLPSPCKSYRISAVFMYFRAEGRSREGPGTISHREAKTQRDGAQSQQHGGGSARPKD